MKTANYYAKLAVDLRRTAQDLKPGDHDPYMQSLRLMEYYLNSAAAKAEQIAEDTVAKETANPAPEAGVTQ